MKVSVVIPAWNAREHLKATLEGLTEIRLSPPVEFEVIVVDNGSRDGTGDMVEAGFPWVKLIRNERNNGFSGANNQGFRAGNSEHVLFLNADAHLNAEALKAMTEFMDAHPKAAQIVVRQVFEDGTFQPSCRRIPILWDDFCDMTFLSTVFPKSLLFNRWRMGSWSHDRTIEVEHPMASCMLARRKALEEVGVFNEDYWPIYYEDVDLAYCLREAGWKSYFLASAQIVHVGSITYREAPTRSIEWWTRGKFIFFSKRHGPRAVRLLALNLRLRAIMVRRLLPLIRRWTGRPRNIEFLARELAAMEEGYRKFSLGIKPTAN